MVAAEQCAFGKREMDARAVDAVHHRDRADQLALQRALIVDLLREISEPHVGLVEQLETDLAALRRVGPGDRDAGGIGLFFWHQDRGAAVAQAIGGALLVELGGDRRSVGRAQVLDEHDVVGAQEQEIAEAEHRHDRREHERDDQQLAARRADLRGERNRPSRRSQGHVHELLIAFEQLGAHLHRQLDRKLRVRSSAIVTWCMGIESSTANWLNQLVGAGDLGIDVVEPCHQHVGEAGPLRGSCRGAGFAQAHRERRRAGIAHRRNRFESGHDWRPSSAARVYICCAMLIAVRFAS